MSAADARLLKLISGGGRRTTFVSLLRDLAHAGVKPEPKPKAAAKTPVKPKAKPKAAKVKAAKSAKPHKGGKKAKKKAA
jgi:hypothetical protein